MARTCKPNKSRQTIVWPDVSTPYELDSSSASVTQSVDREESPITEDWNAACQKMRELFDAAAFEKNIPLANWACTTDNVKNELYSVMDVLTTVLANTDSGTVRQKCLDLFHFFDVVKPRSNCGPNWMQYITGPMCPLPAVLLGIIKNASISRTVRITAAKLYVSINNVRAPQMDGSVCKTLAQTLMNEPESEELAGEIRVFQHICLRSLYSELFRTAGVVREEILHDGFLDYLYGQLEAVKTHPFNGFLTTLLNVFGKFIDFEQIYDHRSSRTFYRILANFKSSNICLRLIISMFRKHPRRAKNFCDAGLFVALLRDMRFSTVIFWNILWMLEDTRSEGLLDYCIGIDCEGILQQHIKNHPDVRDERVAAVIQRLHDAKKTKGDVFEKNFRDQPNFYQRKAPGYNEIVIYIFTSFSALLNFFIIICAARSSLPIAHDISLINGIYLTLTIFIFFTIHKEYVAPIFIYGVMQAVHTVYLLSLVSTIISLKIQLSTNPKRTYNMFIPINNAYDFTQTNYNHLRVGLMVALCVSVAIDGFFWSDQYYRYITVPLGSFRLCELEYPAKEN
ncbi:hypothetical protein QR680_018059 [Steinernema hermaphroditum]|uniref:Uncharacterized protein n=1 Tax=Steinernema hermaphroditum TaxID=289476 RepID=A0AA39LQE7_9BILA|nr:hypothetical protein QR680_018059 [Steinernema hermaphroditum]